MKPPCIGSSNTAAFSEVTVPVSCSRTRCRARRIWGWSRGKQERWSGEIAETLRINAVRLSALAHALTGLPRPGARASRQAPRTLVAGDPLREQAGERHCVSVLVQGADDLQPHRQAAGRPADRRDDGEAVKRRVRDSDHTHPLP